MLFNNWFLGHSSNKLSLDLKSIGHIPKTHLLKMSFDLLPIERLGQRVHHIQPGVNSLHLDELLLEVFAYIMWNHRSMCLNFWWNLNFLARAMALLLSQCSAMTPDDITSSSVMNFLNQKASLAASEMVMYSIFMVESAMIDCLKFFQLTYHH